MKKYSVINLCIHHALAMKIQLEIVEVFEIENNLKKKSEILVSAYIN